MNSDDFHNNIFDPQQIYELVMTFHNRHVCLTGDFVNLPPVSNNNYVDK